MTTVFEDSAGSAVLSSCETWRYSLLRRVSIFPGRLLGIGINPSTADHKVNDMTIRKGMEFARLFNFGLFEMVNAYAIRSRDPMKLVTARDPVGPGNDDWIATAARTASRILVATGDPPRALRDRFAERMQTVNTILRLYAPIVFCVGRTKSGNGHHLSRIGYKVPLEPWSFS